MSAAHPDFARIQLRLRALGLYPAAPYAIDDEWGAGMSKGIDALLAEAEHAKGIEPPAAPLWANLPAPYAWLRDMAAFLPRHLKVALDLLGTVEVAGTGNSATILSWRDEMKAAGIEIAGYTADSVPWCGLFIRYVMFKAEREGVDSPLWALNWAKFGEDGGQPELGDVLTFKREGGGHVALYIAEDKQGFYHILGGNQGDKVSIMRIAKARMFSCRQPPYKNKPSSVVPWVVSATGTISRNEA